MYLDNSRSIGHTQSDLTLRRDKQILQLAPHLQLDFLEASNPRNQAGINISWVILRMPRDLPDVFWYTSIRRNAGDAYTQGTLSWMGQDWLRYKSSKEILSKACLYLFYAEGCPLTLVFGVYGCRISWHQTWATRNFHGRFSSEKRMACS